MGRVEQAPGEKKRRGATPPARPARAPRRLRPPAAPSMGRTSDPRRTPCDPAWPPSTPPTQPPRPHTVVCEWQEAALGRRRGAEAGGGPPHHARNARRRIRTPWAAPTRRRRYQRRALDAGAALDGGRSWTADRAARQHLGVHVRNGGGQRPPALSPVVFSRRHAGRTVRRGASVGQDGSVEAGVGTQGGGWAVSAACWGGVLQLLRPSESEEPTNKKKEGTCRPPPPAPERAWPIPLGTALRFTRGATARGHTAGDGGRHAQRKARDGGVPTPPPLLPTPSASGREVMARRAPPVCSHEWRRGGGGGVG